MYDRRKTIGASDAVLIHEGKWAELYDRKATSDRPSYSLPASIGIELESLNRRWFTRETGLQILYNPKWHEAPFTWAFNPWCTYLPDGLCTSGEQTQNIPFEAKAVNSFWKPSALLRKYMPQLQHAMRAMSAPIAHFSVIYLNTKWEHTIVNYDPIYDQELIRLERAFLWHLIEGIRP